MRKIFAVIISIVILMSSLPIAFAEAADSSSSNAAVVPQELKDKKAALKDLLDQEKQARETLKGLNTDSAGNLKNLKENVKAQRAKAAQLRQTFTQDTKALRDKGVELKNELKQALANKDTAKADEIKNELAALKQQIDAKKAEIAKAKEDLAKENEPFKAQLEKLKALNEQLKPLKDQAKVIMQDINAQGENMKSERSGLKNAVQSKDYTSAGGILDKMLQLVKDRISNLGKLVDIRSKIKELISGSAAV